MINTDKIRAALAATPLCQNNWTVKDGTNPTMLCAVSAMVSFAGVQPDLISAMAKAMGGDQWFNSFARPVLLAEYGIPFHVACAIPRVFDHEENEWRGVTEVLALCESYNMDEWHMQAIVEDAQRFPQHTCAEAPTLSWVTFGNPHFVTSNEWISFATMPPVEKIKVQKAVKKPSAPWLGKKHKHAHKALGY